MDELILGFEQFGLRNLKEEMQTILSDQSKLKEEMQTILSDQSKLKEKMQKNLRDQSQINERIQQLFTRIQNPNTSMFFDDKYFPLDNYDNLNNMDNIISKKIAANDEFKSLLVKEFSLVGGNGVGDMVRRLMNKLFTKKLLSGYTRKGRNNTRNFSELTIHNVIFATIVEKFSDTPTTKQLFEKAIAYNLKRAKDDQV